MNSEQAYLVLDIGTGNVRVAITSTRGDILAFGRDNVRYERDPLYPDSLAFDPDELWNVIVRLTREAVQQAGPVELRAVTSSSQREGVVFLDKDGRDLIGLPNHDHRGREWESSIENKSWIYSRTGRYPSSLFSALKAVGIQQRRPDVWRRVETMLSISDWALFRLSGVRGYEHAQASETQLYDVAAKQWSSELCASFGLSEKILPPLHDAGTVIGNVLPDVASAMNIVSGIPVVVGGADTQLAILSTRPAVGDIILVSGTTTPVVKIVPSYVTDKHQRTWTNRHADAAYFVLETNAGVTGLNYQRLKEVFYPAEGYDVMENELASLKEPQCVASLGSLVAGEPPLQRGGFVFPAPVSHELTRASFVWSTLWDIACAVYENYKALVDVTPHDAEYVWGCGGGFQSPMLSRFIASLLQKEVRVREGYAQASVRGGTIVCNKALQVTENISEEKITTIVPEKNEKYRDYYQRWAKIRQRFRDIV